VPTLAPTRRWRLAWWVSAVGLIALSGLHFALVLVSLLPRELIPEAARGAARAYVAPLFVQNWWLFAPNPPALDRRVDIRGTYVVGGERRVTPWLSLTAPVISAVQRNRLSPRNAAWIVVLNAVYSLTGETGPLRLRGGARELILKGWAETPRQPSGLIVLERAGSAALVAAYPGWDFDQIQLRIVVRRLPPFTDRHGQPSEAAEELLFPPVSFFGDVVPWNPQR
jgi:Family of unknown function (DUF5819)